MPGAEPLPTKEGLHEAIKLLKSLREKKPSDELVQIVNEITEREDKSEDRAAKRNDSELNR